MNTRKLAVAAGVFYLITHVTSVAALALYQPLVGPADYIIGSGSGSRIILGALLEVILALAVVGSAVALYPVVKRKAPAIALGNVGLRTLEAGVIAIGTVSLLTVVAVRQSAVPGADSASLLTAGHVLVGIYDWAFLVGPNLVLATSTMFLAYAMFRWTLVPRWIGVLGLVGAPIIFGRAVGSMFGLYEQVSAWGAILSIPIFAWELSLAFRLIVKGFSETVFEDTDVEQAAFSRSEKSLATVE